MFFLLVSLLYPYFIVHSNIYRFYTIYFFPFIFSTKSTGFVLGKLESLIYLSYYEYFLQVDYTVSCFLVGIHSLASLPKIQIYLWNYSETSFFTSFSNLVASFFYSKFPILLLPSLLLFISLYSAFFLSFLISLFYLFSLLSYFFPEFLFILFLPSQFSLNYSLLPPTFLWTSYHLYLLILQQISGL